MNVEIKDFDSLIQRLTTFDKMYDLTRVVNPKIKEVIFVRKNKELNYANQKDSCYDFWENNEVCSNCISMRAYNENNTFMKIESSAKSIKMVTAIPVIIEGDHLVIELLKDITNSMLVDEEGLEERVIIKKILEQANRAAIEDVLTGTYNKRYINERLPNELIHSKLRDMPLSIIITDIDHFKKVNDIHGHIAGDYVLKEFADILKSNVREDKDFVARFGGEEFLICLIDTNQKEAYSIAQRMRSQIE